MGVALDSLREFLRKFGLKADRRTAASLFVLLTVLILIPVGLFLVRSQQDLLPRAAGELIQLGEGGCIVVNQNKQKGVDCSLVPLKLTNPFFQSNTSSSAPASAGNSAQPSAGGAVTGPVVNVTSFNNDIQAALNSIKATGGAVYVPAGTYTIKEKIRLFSNTTLFGDGIDQTVLQLDESLLQNEDGMLANDTNYGHNNIVVRDMTLKGLGRESGLLQCCVGIKLRQLDGGYLTNIKVEGFSWYGIWLIYKKQTTGDSDTVKNVRISNCQILNNKGSGIALDSPASENVIDNCVLSGNNSGSGEDNYLKSGAAISLFMDEDGAVQENKILNNTIRNNGYIGISVMARNNITAIAKTKIPDNAICHNIVENNESFGIVDGNSEDSNYIGNRISNNREGDDRVETGPVDYYDHSITRWATLPGNTSVGMVEDTNPNATSPECNIPPRLQTIPPAPAKPTAWLNEDSGGLIKKANAQANTGNNVLYRLAETEQGLNQAQWKIFASLPSDEKHTSNEWTEILTQKVYAQDGHNVSPTPNPHGSSSAASSSPSSSVQIGNTSAGVQFILTTFQLQDSQVGPKQIWVQYMHPDGTTKTDNVNFNLVDKPPQIVGLSCNLDISKENLKITIEGLRFGTGIGTVDSVSPSAKTEILGWNNTEITAQMRKPNIPINEGQRFRIQITRSDGFKSGVGVCAVDKSLVSLGARIFCRAPGKFDANDVSVNLVYSPDDSNPNRLNKVEEKVTINANGEIANLKTILQVGKNYAIAIKAPSSLRRATIFTAQEGTTEISQPDGSPFILPVGDIAPTISPDGSINSLDRAELIRQWRILGQTSTNNKLTGDFNRDTRVNSIDWACMNYDFGKSDDPIPTFVPQSASGTINIPGGSPTPSPSSGNSTPQPSPSKDTSNSITLNVGGKLFLDTNRNQVADTGESFIPLNSGTVKLLQVPENHEVGTALTEDEVANSTTLKQVPNNLPGGSYDISVFVDKDSSNKFTIQAAANSNQLGGVVDFAVDTPLANASFVINIPVASVTQ